MKRIPIVMALSALLFACWEDDTSLDFSLPAKTQIGKNTFGCILNAHVWTNYGQVCFPFAGGCRENTVAIYRPANLGGLELYTDRVLKKIGAIISSESIHFSLNGNFNATGNYNIRYIDNARDIIYRDNSTEKIYSCIPDRETFTLQVTKLDTIQKVISGEFSGTLFSVIYTPMKQMDMSDSVVLTEGRFDLKLK
jgi:hypothetical protein